MNENVDARDGASSAYMEKVYGHYEGHNTKAFLFYLDGLEIFNAGWNEGQSALAIDMDEIERLRVVAEQLERWRDAWSSQDTSDAEPARRAMFKALDYWLDLKKGVMDIHKCEFCGKFISQDDFENEKASGQLVWTGGPAPEPSHDVYWHLECKEGKSNDNNQSSV